MGFKSYEWKSISIRAYHRRKGYETLLKRSGVKNEKNKKISSVLAGTILSVSMLGSSLSANATTRQLYLVDFPGLRYTLCKQFDYRKGNLKWLTYFMNHIKKVMAQSLIYISRFRRKCRS